jgi:hypothetical protein
VRAPPTIFGLFHLRPWSPKVYDHPEAPDDELEDDPIMHLESDREIRSNRRLERVSSEFNPSHGYRSLLATSRLHDEREDHCDQQTGSNPEPETIEVDRFHTVPYTRLVGPFDSKLLATVQASVVAATTFCTTTDILDALTAHHSIFIEPDTPALRSFADLVFALLRLVHCFPR